MKLIDDEIKICLLKSLLFYCYLNFVETPANLGSRFIEKLFVVNKKEFLIKFYANLAKKKPLINVRGRLNHLTNFPNVVIFRMALKRAGNTITMKIIEE